MIVKKELHLTCNKSIYLEQLFVLGSQPWLELKNLHYVIHYTINASWVFSIMFNYKCRETPINNK